MHATDLRAFGSQNGEQLEADEFTECGLDQRVHPARLETEGQVICSFRKELKRSPRHDISPLRQQSRALCASINPAGSWMVDPAAIRLRAIQLRRCALAWRI